MEHTSRFGNLSDSLTSFFVKKSKPTAPTAARLTFPKRHVNGQFEFHIQLPKGAGYLLQSSTDLRTWAPLHGDVAKSDHEEYLDNSGAQHRSRFYRALTGEGAYISNCIGFVTLTIPPGFSMIANPLNAGNNRLETIFPAMPDGTTVNKFDTRLFRLTKNSVAGGKWQNPNELLNPGEGAIIQNPTADFKPLSLVGEVPSGDLSVPIPAGFSIRSSILPMRGTLDADLGFPPIDGDVVHLFDPDRQEYKVFTFKESRWTPEAPVIAAAESFWIGKTSPGNWIQTFSGD